MILCFRYGGATFGDISTYLPDINVSAFSLDSLVSATGVRQNARVRTRKIDHFMH